MSPKAYNFRVLSVQTLKTKSDKLLWVKFTRKDIPTITCLSESDSAYWAPASPWSAVTITGCVLFQNASETPRMWEDGPSPAVSNTSCARFQNASEAHRM